MEEKLNNRYLYKIMLLVLKIIPIIIASEYILNTILSIINIEIRSFSYISGIGFLPLIFIYICSYVFKFCIYHRIHIYYIAINFIISIFHYEYNFTGKIYDIILVILILIYIVSFITTYYHVKNNKRNVISNS